MIRLVRIAEGFVFPAERVRVMRQNPESIYATLQPWARTFRKGTIRHFYAELPAADGRSGTEVTVRAQDYRAHLETARQAPNRARAVVTLLASVESLRRVRRIVNDVIDGELRPAVLTIVEVREADLYAAAGLSQEFARAAGFRTVGELRAAWIETHPRSPLARAVYFMLGDRRDGTRYLTSTRSMREGSVGDYTGNPRIACDELPALTPEQWARSVAFNHQKDARRTAEAQRRAASRPLADQIRALEESGERARIRQELRIIASRTQLMERRLGRAG